MLHKDGAYPKNWPQSFTSYHGSCADTGKLTYWKRLCGIGNMLLYPRLFYLIEIRRLLKDLEQGYIDIESVIFE
jgi:hypothetical protein